MAEDHVSVTPEQEREVDAALGLEVVTLRLDKRVVDAYVEYAKMHGMNPLALMRMVLVDYIESE